MTPRPYQIFSFVPGSFHDLNREKVEQFLSEQIEEPEDDQFDRWMTDKAEEQLKNDENNYPL